MYHTRKLLATLLFVILLLSIVSSTGKCILFHELSFQVKGKEAKDGKDKSGAANGHQFVPASPSGPAVCVACDKSVSVKELLQCSSKNSTEAAAVLSYVLWWLNCQRLYKYPHTCCLHVLVRRKDEVSFLPPAKSTPMGRFRWPSGHCLFSLIIS